MKYCIILGSLPFCLQIYTEVQHKNTASDEDVIIFLNVKLFNWLDQNDDLFCLLISHPKMPTLLDLPSSVENTIF